jgi:hypothetical protein
MLTDLTAHGEDTLFKVQAAITALGYSGQPVLDIIAALQNKGILFRERVPEGWLDKGPEPTETDPDLMPPKRGFDPESFTGIGIINDPALTDTEREADRNAEEARAVSDDRPELSQAEEPVEQRISRAFANGWREGFERAQWGTRWDHS